MRKITVDLKQPTFLKSYEAAVLDAERIAFEIPAKDAARLNLSYPVKWQILARDALGDRWTRAKTCTVEEVLHGGVWE